MPKFTEEELVAMYRDCFDKQDAGMEADTAAIDPLAEQAGYNVHTLVEKAYFKVDKAAP
jgi:hypothetical protein